MKLYLKIIEMLIKKDELERQMQNMNEFRDNILR